MSSVAIENANLQSLIVAAHDAGVEPGTPLTTMDKEGKQVDLKLGTIKVTFEIINESSDDDEESGDDDEEIADDDKLGYGLTPKDGECSKFRRNVSIEHAFCAVRYGGQGYQKVGDKWIKPGTPINDEAIRRKSNKGDWLKLPQFLVERTVMREDGTEAKEMHALKELGAKYNYRNLKPDTLWKPLIGVVVEPRTPAKSKPKPETLCMASKKRTCEEESEPVALPSKKPFKKPLKKPLKKPPNKENLMKLVGAECPKGNLATIYTFILEHVVDKKLERIHSRYFGKTPPPPAGGKQPSAAIKDSIMKEELRELWGL